MPEIIEKSLPIEIEEVLSAAEKLVAALEEQSRNRTLARYNLAVFYAKNNLASALRHCRRLTFCGPTCACPACQ